METGNIPGGTVQITLVNASQYLIIGLFYIVVAKTNALTQADIGALSILSFLGGAFSLLTGLALPTALVKFSSEKLGADQEEEAAAVQKTVARTVLTLSIVGFVIVALSSQLLSGYLWNNSEYVLFVILILINAFLGNTINLCNSTLQALYLFGKMATVTITLVISSRVAAGILALLHKGVEGVLVGYIVGSLIALVAAVALLRGKLPKTKKNTSLKPLLRFSLPLLLSSLTILVLDWADVLIVDTLISDRSLTGVYYMVINSVGSLSVLYLPVMTTILPALSARYGLKNAQNVSNLLKTTSRYLLLVIFPSCFGLAIIAPTALSSFYGAGYTRGATPLAILSIDTITIATYTLFTTTLIAIGKTGPILKINIISALSAILVLPALVPLFGTTGAALTRAITHIITFALVAYTLRKEIRIQLDKEALWKFALASAATIPFLLTLEMIVSVRLSTIQTLAIELITGAGIYLFLLYVLKALNSQDFELLRQAFPKPFAKYLKIIESIMVRRKS